MFVKTQFDTIVNLNEFQKIQIGWSARRAPDGNVFHVISAVSEEETTQRPPQTRTVKSETLAQFSTDMPEKVKEAYQELFTALSIGDITFDMTEHTEGAQEAVMEEPKNEILADGEIPGPPNSGNSEDY